jgi:hypothetical protein
VDHRLRCAIDASIGWYDDLCALHGTASMLADGLWSALGPPPPLHSAAVTVEDNVSAERVLERLAQGPVGGVKDSFSTVDLGAAGWELLFEATWLHLPAPDVPATAPAGWQEVRDVPGLQRWTSGHDTAQVLLPGLLRSAHFRVLAKVEDERVVAGAVARLGSGIVDLSNVHGDGLDWSELVGTVACIFPGRPLVGYEQGNDLAAALTSGFSAVGPLRVWVP